MTTPALNPVLLAIKIHFHQINRFKDSFEAYKDFCENYGNDSISFRDFDFWWYRFKEGKFGLDYDRSKDPKKPELSDIPLDILEEVIEKLEWTDRCIFRKVSKSCRSLVDHQKFIFDRIELETEFVESALKIDNQTIWYRQGPGNRTICEIRSKGIRRNVCLSGSENLAIQELCLALGNPNIKIKKLTLILSDPFLIDHLQKFLDTLNYKIHVESLHISSDLWDVYNNDAKNEEDYRNAGLIQKHAAKVLPYLKPGILKNIDIGFAPHFFRNNPIIDFDEIADLEQWKQAKQLKINFEAFTQVEQLFNFSRLELHVNLLLKKHVELIKELASKSPNFESGRLTFDRNYFNLEELLEVESIPFTENGLFIDGDYNYVIFEKI